jgi:hypothetical protein
MPRTLADIFTGYPGVDVLEVVSSDDGGPFGLSADGRRLKILDDNFAQQLAGLPERGTQKPATLPLLCTWGLQRTGGLL